WPAFAGSPESTKIRPRTGWARASAIRGKSRPLPLWLTSTTGSESSATPARTASTHSLQPLGAAPPGPSNDGETALRPRFANSAATGAHVPGPTRGLWTSTKTGAWTISPTGELHQFGGGECPGGGA